MATLLKNLYSQEFIKKLSNSLKNSHKDFKIDEFKKNPPNRTGDALLESLKNKAKH